VGRC